MMLQFNTSIVVGFVILNKSPYFQAFIGFKIYLRKPCSFDFVT
jgi:hypothetical protein